MKWNLASINRAAAERELKAKGKKLSDYPWPEDAAPEFAGSRAIQPKGRLCEHFVCAVCDQKDKLTHDTLCPCVHCVNVRLSRRY